jgi:hypothetical protein
MILQHTEPWSMSLPGSVDPAATLHGQRGMSGIVSTTLRPPSAPAKILNVSLNCSDASASALATS